MNAGECYCIKIHVPSPTEHNTSLLGRPTGQYRTGK